MSIVTVVGEVVFAVNGEIVTYAGAALRTGVVVTTTLAARIETLEISPIDINLVFENAVEITELTLIIPDVAMLPGKCQFVPDMATLTLTSEITSE